MLLEELLAELSYSELSNLSMALEGNGTVREQDRPKVITALNDALLKLYSRFILKRNEVLIQMYPHITNYHLLKKYALSQQEPEAEGFFYIRDLTGEPFAEDVIKILEVRNSLYQTLPLNDPDAYNSCFTPQGDVLQVPEPMSGVVLSLIYQARHAKIDRDANPMETEIVLPQVLHGAMRSYVAYSIFTNMNTQEATAKAQEHLGNYEAACLEAIDKDLVNSSMSSTNVKFDKRGFV